MKRRRGGGREEEGEEKEEEEKEEEKKEEEEKKRWKRGRREEAEEVREERGGGIGEEKGGGEMEGEKRWTWRRWCSCPTKRWTHLNTVAGIKTYKSVLPCLYTQLHQACPKCSGVILHLEQNKMDYLTHTDTPGGSEHCTYILK